MPNDTTYTVPLFERMLSRRPSLRETIMGRLGTEGIPLSQLTTLTTGRGIPLTNLDIGLAYLETRVLSHMREERRTRVAEYLKSPPYDFEPKYITPAILPAATPYRPTLWEHLDDDACPPA